ncbi:MOSC domain-containing protein [Alteromonas sp. RKMC-009]|uniref:MOSC domain-containing protein n=1 Tax=Alteromonas sp. RKMC-009 TaxID=2267264 RepID=UPI000E689009|nr:MOSC domain-containing protein [Alteromonas sp. RKMC-009]AYA62949.1 MOSC domain-containing protein [Alteromonas sp. RKMC-009]
MHIEALYAAKPVPFGPRGAPSAIQKQPVPFLTVLTSGTEEDEQGNKKLHGGPEKVLHQFSHRGYERLSEAFPEGNFVPGTIGENLIVEGMDDTNVFIGDVWQMGEIVVQVGAPRAPCNKISQRFDIKNLDRFVGNEGITGWYFRVIETGTLNTGDEVKLISRADKTVSVADLMTAVYDKGNPEKAAEYVQLDVLDDEWKGKCERVIKRGQ